MYACIYFVCMNECMHACIYMYICMYVLDRRKFYCDPPRSQRITQAADPPWTPAWKKAVIDYYIMLFAFRHCADVDVAVRN